MTGVFAPLVSELVGIVPRVDLCLAAAGEARMHTAVCTPAATAASGGDAMGHVGTTGGYARTAAAATAAALGEAVERYSATFVPDERLVVATADELGPAAVAPERFALFAPHQHAQPRFPFVPFTRSTRVAWTRGRALDSGDEAWLPAELVYLGDAARGARVGYATSSGAACGPDAASAAAAGLLELLERDAFVLAWRNRLSLPLLEWRGHRKLARLDDRFFAPSGLRYSVVDLSAVHRVPAALAVVRAPRRRAGAIGVGAAAAPTAATAWWKALAEAFASHAAARRLRAVAGPPPEPDGIVDFHDHIHYYGDPANGVAADFLDACRDRVDVRDVVPLEHDPRAPLAPLVARVLAAGATPYSVDVTAPDIARLGLRVVKTVAPELCALDAVHRLRFLGGERQLTAAYRLGLASRRFDVHELNPDPHPFP